MPEICACIGLHWILKYGSILNLPRDIVCRVEVFRNMLKCSLCLGFWCGVMIGLYTSNVLLPLISAGACWFIDNINNTLQSAEIKLDKH